MFLLPLIVKKHKTRASFDACAGLLLILISVFCLIQECWTSATRPLLPF